MPHLTLIDNLRCCADRLENALSQLQAQLQALPLLVARVFTLPPIEKGQEHTPVTTIAVTQHTGKAALEIALQHYCRLYIYHQSEKISTKAAVRLPGILCFEAEQQQAALIQQQIRQINALKANLEHIITVEAELAPEARFEFVHRHLRGLITLNAYREVTLIEQVHSVRFGWANKNIIKHVSVEEIRQQLEKSLKSGRAVTPWTREQWAEKVTEELEILRSLPPACRLKIKRPVKVQPVARLWNRQQQKQTQRACPSPLLMLCDRNSVPVTGELLNYNAATITHRYKPKAQPLYEVIPRLHLYSDRPF